MYDYVKNTICVWLVVRNGGVCVCGCVRSVCMVGSKDWVCVGV